MTLGTAQSLSELKLGQWVIASSENKFCYALVANHETKNRLLSLFEGRFSFLYTRDEDIFYLLPDCSIIPDTSSISYISPNNIHRPSFERQLIIGTDGAFVIIKTDRGPLRFLVSSGELVNNLGQHYILFSRWKVVQTRNNIDIDLFYIETEKSTMDVTMH